MNRSHFYAALRSSASLFGGSLSQGQVDGINSILDACERNRVTDIRHVAHSLAEVFHETGEYMLPIKETVYASHKNKNPSDKTVIARLDAAWKKGQLGTVSTPYWRAGWFGRGQIQITHEENYRKLGKRLGVDLVGNPALALDLRISADIAVVGMAEGLFRKGHTLARYFNATTDDPVGARNIVNGDVKTNGAHVAKYHRTFLAALMAAEKAVDPPVIIPAPLPPVDDPVVSVPPATPAAPEKPRGFFRWLLSFLGF